MWEFLIGQIQLLALLITCFITEKRHSTYSYSADSTLQYFEDSPSRRDLDGTRRNSNLPLFDLRTIIAATDNFSIANKLGQGGFGPVYKVVSLNESQNLHNLISSVFMHHKFHHECLQVLIEYEFVVYNWASPNNSPSWVSFNNCAQWQNDIWTSIAGFATKWNGNSSKETIKMLWTRNRTIQNGIYTNC